MKIMTFNPRPEIYIQGKKTVPQRVFFEQIHGRPPQGRLQRLKTVCSIPMCVNPDCFQETAPTAPPAPSGELDGDFEAIRQSLQADIDNGIPYRPPHYEMWEEEIVVVVQHHPHIAAWMATGPR